MLNGFANSKVFAGMLDLFLFVYNLVKQALSEMECAVNLCGVKDECKTVLVFLLFFIFRL